MRHHMMGAELTESVVHLGPSPRQNVIPVMEWLVDKGKSRFLVVGENQIYTSVAGEIISDYVDGIDGAICSNVNITEVADCLSLLE